MVPRDVLARQPCTEVYAKKVGRQTTWGGAGSSIWNGNCDIVMENLEQEQHTQTYAYDAREQRRF